MSNFYSKIFRFSGDQISIFPLTFLVIVTTMLRHSTASDNC